MNGFDLDFSDAGFWLEPDFVLADMVATLVNLMDIPIGVTLFIKGMVISGVLVSEKEYLESLTSVFNRIARESIGETKDNYEPLFDFTALNESPDSMETNEDEDNDLELPPPVRHLHLKDVYVLTPQPSIAFTHSMLPIMRIRLAVIDGWFLGQAMSVDDDLPDDNLSNNSNGSPRILH